MLDDDDLLFTIADLKQYIYCPRIFYYQACLPDIRPITHNMRAGMDAHEVERKRAERRSVAMYGIDTGERHFDVPVRSTRLWLTGKIDEVVDTGSELIPVDYKLAEKAGYHFKVQLAAYALLLEEARAVSVRRGFLYLIPRHRYEEVTMEPKLRRTVQRALDDMRDILLSERMPPHTDWRQRCPDCEFRRFCNDV